MGVGAPGSFVPDKAVAILVEHPEGLPDLLLAVRILHLPRHHRQELWEVDGAVTLKKKSDGKY